MVNTKNRFIIFFAAKDEEALYSQQKEDEELTVRKRASPRGEAGTSGFLCVSDSDRSPGREAALARASLAQRFPASSVLAREGAGCAEPVRFTACFF